MWESVFIVQHFSDKSGSSGQITPTGSPGLCPEQYPAAREQ